MSKIIQALRDSSDPLENDLALVYDHWQDGKRSLGKRAGLGYEPRDLKALGPETVISRRVLKASTGFEEVDEEQSYEALVLKYSERFSLNVITAAQKRLKHGTGNKIKKFQQQDIQFFIKTSAIELFGECSVQPLAELWVGRNVQLPKLDKKNNYANEILFKGFRGLVWLHEQEKDGESGKGLTAVVEFGPMQMDRSARIYDAMFFSPPIGRELIYAHKEIDSFISKMAAMRHSRVWPIWESDVDTFLFAALEKIHEIATANNLNPDPYDPINLEKTEDTTALRKVVLRRHQAAFRQTLLNKRSNCCAITGTSELSVLEAAHIIPYAERFADRDKPENGILLRRDIHKLFDAHLISINPETKEVEISSTIECQSYLPLRGKIISDNISSTSLEFHYKSFKK